MVKIDKFDKLRLKYPGIEFIPCPFNKIKFSWKWNTFSGVCIKYSDLEYNIENSIEMRQKLFGGKNPFL